MVFVQALNESTTLSTSNKKKRIPTVGILIGFFSMGQWRTPQQEQCAILGVNGPS